MARKRSRDDQARIDLLRSLEGVDLVPGTMTGKEPSSQLRGMVQRVKCRAWRRRLGLPCAPLHANSTCVACGTATRDGKGSQGHPDVAAFERWRGEWVEVHARCLDQLTPSPEVVEVRGGECFRLS